MENQKWSKKKNTVILVFSLFNLSALFVLDCYFSKLVFGIVGPLKVGALEETRQQHLRMGDGNSSYQGENPSRVSSLMSIQWKSASDVSPTMAAATLTQPAHFAVKKTHALSAANSLKLIHLNVWQLTNSSQSSNLKKGTYLSPNYLYISTYLI